MAAIAAVATVMMAVLSPGATAHANDDPIAEAEALESAARELSTLIRARDDQQAAALLVELESRLAALDGDDTPAPVRRRLSSLERRLRGYRQQLERRGVELPNAGGGDDDAMGAAAFRSEIAPLLLAQCGGCHVDRSRGGLSLTSYERLLRGSDSGPVIVPGNSGASPLIALVESGDMPRGRPKLTGNEIALLRDWIDAGAPATEADRQTPLAQLARAGDTAETMSMLMPTKPAGGETVSFRRDLAPVVVEQCVGCHGGDRPARNLGLDRFARLLRGGTSGPILEPGKPDDSLLIQKLAGTAGARMPLDRPPLDDDVIALFKTWIAEGATFDGPDPGQSLEQLILIDEAGQLSPDELAARRVELGLAAWHLANPDEEPRRHEDERFLVLGNVSATQLEAVARAAGELVPQLARQLRIRDTSQLVPGRLTIFLLRNPFDYTEFARMVEGRALDQPPPGHWRYNVLDAYACLSMAGNPAEEVLRSRLSELLAGATIDALGDVPAWFAQGAARAVRSRITPRDAEVIAWNDRLDKVLYAGEIQPETVLTGTDVSDDVAILRYGLVRFLLSSPGNRFHNLLAALDKGDSFNDALRASFGGDADYVAGVWLRQMTGSRRR